MTTDPNFDTQIDPIMEAALDMCDPIMVKLNLLYPGVILETELRQDLSPDTSQLLPPSTGAIRTLDGTWNYEARAFDATHWFVDLNGVNVGAASIMYVAGGKMYVIGRDNHWHVWNNGAFAIATDPRAA